MFHVERTSITPVNSRAALFLIVIFVLFSCISTKQSMQIPDYILVPNGKKIIGTNPLVAFVFENNQTKMPFEQYLSLKFKTDNFQANQIWITIDQVKYKIIVYDYHEFEKYFYSANYAVINQEPESNKIGDQRKFIALSIVNEANEDCLANNSLFQSKVITYLKDLKVAYLNK